MRKAADEIVNVPAGVLVFTVAVAAAAALTAGFLVHKRHRRTAGSSDENVRLVEVP